MSGSDPLTHHSGRARAQREAGARTCAQCVGPFVPLMMSKRGKQVDYAAKTHRLLQSAGSRKDAANRASIVAALERQLAKGDKALVGNSGFRRYWLPAESEL